MTAPQPTTKPKVGFTPKLPKKKPLTYMRLSDVEPEEVNWLWYPYIPAGKLSLIEGDPGMGKSWITCAIAAAVSLGHPLPGQKENKVPQKVLMLSAEDGLGDTVRPRIEALGGNMDNIFVSDDFFILNEEGIKDLEDLMRTVAATVVFMDPIVAYMGAKVDMHRANEVRGLMTALAGAAKRTGSAIVAVRHLRKGGSGGGGKAIYAGIGSIDFTAAVRSVMQVGETKSGTKFVFHAKHNLTPKGDTLSYEIVDKAFRWSGTLEVDDMEAGQLPQVSTTPRMKELASNFLFDILRDGPQPAVDILEKAQAAGVPPRTLNRAKVGLVISVKKPDGWYWQLKEREGIDG